MAIICGSMVEISGGTMFWYVNSKDPAVLKTLRDSELLRTVFLLRPPYALRCEHFSERKMLVKPRK